MRRQRVIVCESRGLTASVVQTLLEQVADVVVAARDARALVVSAIETQPDLVVCDLDTRQLSGLDVARVLRLIAPRVRVIIVAGRGSAAMLPEVFAAGVSAWVHRSRIDADLLPAARATLRAERFVSPSLADQPPVDDLPQLRLTDREREVIQLLADGKPMREAAAILRVTARTIAFHKYRAMKKLGVKSSAELIRVAVTERLVS